MDVFVDSDWAGDRVTRRSTSGGVVSWAGGVLKTWSKRQSCTATSSGEAELHSLAKGMAEALGIRSVAADLGWEVKLRIWTDSSAAKSIASRTGIGRTRHIDVSYLWVQEIARMNFTRLKKIDGRDNVSDVLTKPKGAIDLQNLLGKVNIKIVQT